MRQNELFWPGEAGDELETASVAQQGSVHQRKDATGKPASGRRGQRSPAWPAGCAAPMHGTKQKRSTGQA